MAKRIGVLEAAEPQTAEPRSHASKQVAKLLVTRRYALQLGPRVIQMLTRTYREAKALVLETLKPRTPKIRIHNPYHDGPLGVGNAIPFASQSDGGRLHYDMPHAGDIGLWRHYRKFIRVSARPQSHLAAQFLQRTQPKALALADAFSR